ncbi:MAG TPA: PIN domain-containing protein [Thermoanaerobaculia bacterium]|nr:PIN domain-containing protein [Thermoanaerobaculia bacterium]
MLSYLLDSALLIDHFNGIEAATRFLEENHAACAISPITRAEVLTGFDLGRPADAAPARTLIDRFPTLLIDGDIADLAALLRHQHRWRLPDAFQAAVALRHDLRLVTRDSDDFPPERHEWVVIPYRV